MILVIAEQRGGKLNRATWETVAAAQQIAGSSGSTADEIVVALPGSGIDSLARELAGTSAPDVKELVTIDSAALEFYTADGYTAALQQAIEQLVTDSRRTSPYLSDARLCADAGGPNGPRVDHRRDGGEGRHQPPRVRSADVPGKVHRRCRA